jgi:hypothetical protein
MVAAVAGVEWTSAYALASGSERDHVEIDRAAAAAVEAHHSLSMAP